MLIRIIILVSLIWLVYDFIISINNNAVEKSILYFYPKEDTELVVKLKHKDLITSFYPQYIDGWHILAKPNGDLIDLSTNRKLYSLYYESKQNYNFKVQDTGFVVKDSDIISFLEDKLLLLGLNEKETEEFIIYWLPKLQKNKYNYIRFATDDEINNNMPLELSQNPDTLIRVLMTYKGLDKAINVKPQEIPLRERNGFTVVEWSL